MAVIPRLLLAAIAFACVIPFATAILGSAPAEAKSRRNPPSASLACVPDSLKAVLSEIEQKFGPVRVISTHRPGATIAGSRKASLHRDCRAVDFVPPRGSRRAVIASLRADPRVQGLGLYRSGHIHIDNGPYRVTWNR